MDSRALRGRIVLALLVIVLALPRVAAEEPSPLPSTLFGEVSTAAGPLPAGVTVSAAVGGHEVERRVVASVAGTGTVFELHVRADLPTTSAVEGGRAGDAVELRIGDFVVAEAMWTEGTFQRVDLTAPIGPDLSLSLTDARADVARGDTLAYGLTVTNAGPGDATGVRVTQTPSPYTVFVEATEGAVVTGSSLAWPPFDLAEGDARVLSATVRVKPATPVSVTEIATTATVERDPSTGFDPEPSNNTATDVDGLAAPEGELPDLAITTDGIEVVPPRPQGGDLVDVTVLVRNAGLASAADVPLVVYGGDPGDGAPVAFSTVFASVAPGGTRSATFTWTASEGVHALVAVVDPDATILELSTENNRADRNVAVPRLAGPNLVARVADATALGGSPAASTLIGAVDVAVRNTGDQAVSAATLVRLFEDLDGDGALGDGEPVLATATVPSGLAAGGEAIVTLSFDATTAFFHPLVWIEVDADDAVDEQREDDNLTPLFGDCTVPPPAPSLEPIVEWSAAGLEVETAPVVVQLSDDDGDGAIDSRDTPDVVFHTVDAAGRALVALSGFDGSRLWTLRSSPQLPLVKMLGQVAAADLDGDGVAEVIGHLTDGRLFAVGRDGVVLWTSDVVEGVGDVSLDGPSVGDLDGDGVPEIAIGRAVLSNSGRLLAVGTKNRGQNVNQYGPFGSQTVPGTASYAHSSIADVDLDGRAELVAGDTVYRYASGVLSVVWDGVVPDNLMKDGFSAVGNLDSDPQAEIVYVSSGQILVYNHDGSILAGRRTITPFDAFTMPTFWGGPPAIADLDGDGNAEILVSGATELVAFHANLSAKWRREIGPDFGGITGVTAFDLDGDGASEVLFNDETTFYVLDGRDGSVIHSRRNASKTASEHPVVADVDGDGRAEILLPSNVGFDGDASTQGLHVLGHPSWQGTREIWNQYSYHVTNVMPDGSVPSPERPGWASSPARRLNLFRANEALPPPEVGLPNLTVSLPRVGAPKGEGIPVTLRLGNGGPAPVGPGVVIALHRGEPGATPEAELVTTGGLRPGAFTDVTVHWRAATLPGTAMTAVVDDGNSIQECAEDDNELALVLDATLLPDLRVEAVAAPAQATVGQKVTVSARVRNDGLADAGATRLRLTLGATPVAEADVAALAASGAVDVPLLWDTLGAAAGATTLAVRVDPDGLVPESDENNNSATATVTLVAATLPDLAAESLVATPPAAAEGAPVVLTATVQNRGGALAGSFEAAFVVNAIEEGRISSGPLAAGELRQLSFELPTIGRSGTFDAEVRLDPALVIAEVAETNNSAAVRFTVNPSPFGVVVTPDRTSYEVDSTAAILVRVTNGDANELGGRLVVRVRDALSAVVAEVADDVVTVPPGTLERSFSWAVGATAAGTYLFEAVLFGGEEPDAPARARGVAVFLVAPDLRVEATLSSDRDVLSAGEAATLLASVTNRSRNVTLGGLTARIAVTAVGGAEVHAATSAVAAIPLDATVQLSSAWAVGPAAPGAYAATLSIRDAEGFLVGYATTPLTVASSGETGAGLTGTVVVEPDPVGAGATIELAWTATNAGNADMPALVLRAEIARQDDEIVIETAEAAAPLARGATAAGVFGFGTAGLGQGTYLATLVGVLPGGERRLDRVPFTVVPGISVGDAEVAEGDDGEASLVFPVRLSEPLPDPVRVDWTTADGTAEAGLDYRASGGSIELAAGETETTVAVPVLGDLLPEADETLILRLSLPAGAVLADFEALGTIGDEEGCPGPSLAWTLAGSGLPRGYASPAPLADPATATAAGPAALVATGDLAAYGPRIDAGGQRLPFEVFVHVPAGGSARVVLELRDGAGAVVVASDSGDLTPGPWRAVVHEPTVPAGAREAVLRLTTAGAGASFDRPALFSLETPVLELGEASVVEGDSGTTPASFPLRLSCALPVDLDLDVSTYPGTAKAGTDFEAAHGPRTVPGGSTELAIEVPVLGDTVDEVTETFELTVTTPSTDVVALRPRAKGSILDDDGAVGLAVDDVAASEGAGTATFTVRLSEPSGKPIRVSYATLAATATSPADFAAASGGLVFEPGAVEQSVLVSIVDDGIHEAEESLLVRLADPVDAVLIDSEAVATIADDDEVGISVADATATEGDPGAPGTAVFTLGLSVPSALETRVGYRTADGTAIAGLDYEEVAGTTVFPPGTVERTVSVPLVADLEQEVRETFTLVLDSPSGGVLVDPEGVGTIVDEDGVYLSISDAVVFEGDVGTVDAIVPVTLSSAWPSEVSVTYRTVAESATEGVDYQPIAGTLVFPAGTTRLDLLVPVVGDLDAEGEETIFVELSSPAGALLLAGSARVAIADDDLWHVNGTASERSAPGCVQLTPDATQVAGTAWRKAQIDLSLPFDKTFAVSFGNRTSDGGDGMTFALQNLGPTALGGANGRLGYADGNPPLRPSIGVATRTFPSFADPDTLTIVENASLTPLAPPLVPRPGAASVTDGQTHALRIVWNPAHGILDTHFDGAERVQYRRDLVGAIFGGDSTVWYGLTAGTSFFRNAHTFCETALCVGTTATPLVSIGDVRLAEGNAGTTTMRFPVTLSCPTDHDVSVDFATEDGTGSAGEDYVAVSGTLVIPAGTTAGYVDVEVVADAVSDGVEDSFVVRLSNVTGGELRYAVGTGTIVDDDEVWTLVGSAAYGPPGCVTLTPDRGGLAGAAWRKGKLDLRQHFDRSFDVFLGHTDASGGHGVAFALQNKAANALGLSDGNLGIEGAGFSLVPTLSARLSTHGLAADSLWLQTRSATVPSVQSPIVPIAASSPNVEDAMRHRLRVVWNADAQQLDVHFDDAERLVFAQNVLGGLFLADPTVWWGLTAATGNGIRNEQYFCEVDACFGTSAQPSVSIGDARLLEGNGGGMQPARFPLTLSCPTDHPVVVSYATRAETAAAGTDFAAASGEVTFQPGETSKTISIPVVNDTVAEIDETFAVELTAIAGGVVRHERGVATIESDDVPIRAVPPRLVEGSVTFGPTHDLVLELGQPLPTAQGFGVVFLDGTARNGVDYNGGVGVTFPAGGTRSRVTFRPIGDTLVENDETFTVRIVPFAGTRIAPTDLVFTIVDDDACPTPNLLADGSFEAELAGSPWTVVSGAWRRQARFATNGIMDGSWVLVGVAPAAEIVQELDVSTFDEAIDAGGQAFVLSGWSQTSLGELASARILLEYLGAQGQILDAFDSGALKNPPGTFGPVRFDDGRFAPPGTRRLRFHLFAFQPANPATFGEVGFDAIVLQALRHPSFLVGDVAVAEGETGTITASFPVRLTCSAPVAVHATYVTRDGTARAGDDYRTTVGEVAIPAGTLATTVAVPVLGDARVEPAETFFLDLVASLHAGVADGRGVGTILPDEVQVSALPAAVSEGSDGETTAASLTLRLSAASPLAVSVDYRTVDGDGVGGPAASGPADFLPGGGTVTFAPGELTKNATVALVADGVPEGDERFFVELASPVNAALGTARATVTILDDDLGLRAEDAGAVEGNAGSTPLVFRVTLPAPTPLEVRVDYATADGTAEAGVDYEAASGTLVVPPGALAGEVAVPVLGDTQVEAGETLFLRLSNPVHATLARAEATGFIADDEDCPSPSLVRNGGAEEPGSGWAVPGWEEVTGADWRPFRGGLGTVEGGSHFYSSTDPTPGVPGGVAELRQDVDVTPFAGFIDRGIQRFAFQAFVATPAEPVRDSVRVVVEFRASRESLLDFFDSGELSPEAWRPVADVRLAPAGTRLVRIRLVTKETTGPNADGYFDAVSLTALGTPALVVPRVEIAEGDVASSFGTVSARLTCALEGEVRIGYRSADRTALAGIDYRALDGELVLAPGETQKNVEIEILPDTKGERLETFALLWSVPPAVSVLRAETAVAIRDADVVLAPVPGSEGSYSGAGELERGDLVGVEHDPAGGLRLIDGGSTFPYVWVALSARGTIAKIHAVSGEVLGEYSTNPDNRGNSDPSRTTVALDGSVWVANRAEQAVAHVGLVELHQCVDRNGNGAIETSTRYGQVLPWPNASNADTSGGVTTAQDECILDYVRVATGGTRHVSVTADNDVWVSGTSGARSFDLVDESGGILRTVPGFACGGYGGLTDADGIVWSTTWGSLLRWSPSVDPPTAQSRRCLSIPNAYGLAVDADGWIWVSDAFGGNVYKVSPDGNTVRGPFPHGNPNAQGLAVDGRGDVWVTSSTSGGAPRVGHLRNDGGFVGNVDGVCRGSTGAAVDALGKIWVACLNESKAARIDPESGPLAADGTTRIGEVDLLVDLPGSSPYNYSDMTGFQALQRTVEQGSWTVIQDSGGAGACWGRVTWTEAGSGEIAVEVRAADLLTQLGAVSFERVESGASFEASGRYLEVRVTLNRGADGESPVLSDLRVESRDANAVAVDDVSVDEGAPGDGRTALLTVSLAKAGACETRVRYATADGSALAGIDYTAVSGELVFAPGETAKTVAVAIVGDLEVEAQESFTLVLGPTFNASIADGSGTATIVDDDLALEPALRATKADALADDADADGQPSPGDAVAYTVTITNEGDGEATAVVFRDLAPEHATIVAGSISTDRGTVLAEDPVEVEVGALAAGATVTITFSVRIAEVVPLGVESITNQGTVLSEELPAVPTDDPDLGGEADPTVTAIVARPRLVAEKRDALAEDRDGDGVPSPGDVLAYSVLVKNLGNTTATGVAFLDPVPAHTAIVAGSLATSAGTVESEDPPSVAIGSLAPDTEVSITFRVEVADPIPAEVREVANQGTVLADGQGDVPTDDPDAGGTADSTVTPIAAAPELRVEKTASLFADPDGDGAASPGDELLYRITIENAGNTAATSVVLRDELDADVSLVFGSVQTDVGSVASQDPLEVAAGEVAAGATATVTFRVQVADPFPAERTTVANQAAVTSAELEPVSSDDPSTDALGDTTVTAVVVAPPPILTVADLTLTESTTATVDAVFALTLSAASAREARVAWTTADGSAVAVMDYTAAAGVAVFPPGTTEVAVTVAVLPDSTSEAEETFYLRLFDPVGLELPDAEAVATIVDGAPPRLGIEDATVVEGDTGTVAAAFTVTLDRASGLPVRVDYGTLADTASTADYVPVIDVLEIPAGERTAEIVVEVVGDLVDEGDEGFTLFLGEPDHALLGDDRAEGTILDDDDALVSVGDVEVEEGDSGTTTAAFPVSLSTTSDREVRVDWTTTEGTAEEGIDFLAGSGTVVFAAGETELGIEVEVVGDLLLEDEEGFEVELSRAIETAIADGLGVGTILDDEVCPGPSLLANGDAEARPEGGEIPGWTAVEGSDWHARLAPPEPFEGRRSLAPGDATTAELVQEVDVSAYAARIDAGDQVFVFTGRVRTFDEVPADVARVVVELLDAGGLILDDFDSGDVLSPNAWREVRADWTAPVGTRRFRVRLLAARFAGLEADAYFDALELRSLRAPVVSVADTTVFEGDSGTSDAVFTVSLACAFEHELTLTAATTDGTAVAGDDYLAAAGTVTFPAGETLATVAVLVVGDETEEPEESFGLALSGLVGDGGPVLLDPLGLGTILDDDFCPRSHGYWKTHRELWPVDWIWMGGREVEADEMMAWLSYKGPDASGHLALQLVATKLNLARGGYGHIAPVVAEADAFLVQHPAGSNPKGPARAEATRLKDLLDAYNNTPCAE